MNLKMKKLLFLPVLAALIFCSCERREIQGIWMCSYFINESSDSTFSYSPCQKLIEIDADEIHFKKFKDSRFSVVDTVVSYPYEFKNDFVYYDEDSIYIREISKDSLIIIPNLHDATTPAIFKRVSEIESPHPTFEPNQLYKFQTPVFTDTFEFKDDGTIMFQNQSADHDGHYADWYISPYKSLNIFYNSHYFTREPLIITGTTPNGITFKIFSTKILDGTLEKIPAMESRTHFEGTWVEESTSDRLIFFNHLKKDDYFNFDDSLAQLTFDADSVYISQFNTMGKFKYDASYLKTHLWIELPDSIENSRNWHLNNPTDSTLEVNIGMPGFFLPGAGTVIFKRKN